jgi:hypothetical protein
VLRGQWEREEQVSQLQQEPLVPQPVEMAVLPVRPPAIWNRALLQARHRVWLGLGSRAEAVFVHVRQPQE